MHDGYCPKTRQRDADNTKYRQFDDTDSILRQYDEDNSVLVHAITIMVSRYRHMSSIRLHTFEYQLKTRQSFCVYVYSDKKITMSL